MVDDSLNIRKSYDLLSSAGYGVLLFGVWSLIKILLVSYCPLNKQNLITLLSSSSIDIFLRFLIGFFALRESKKGKKSTLLTIINIIFFLFDIGVFIYFSIVIALEFNVISLLLLLSDAIFIFIFTSLIIQSIKLSFYYPYRRNK